MYIPIVALVEQSILYVWQMKCQWMKNWLYGWIRCETLINYWRIDYWCLMDILATDLWHEFEPMNLTPIGLYNFAPQSTRHLRLQRKATKNSPLQRWVKRCECLNVSHFCIWLPQIHPKAAFDFQVGSTSWRYNVKNQSICHAESHFERFHYIAAAEHGNGL